MSNDELDTRIRACAALVRALIGEIEKGAVTIEQAVAMGALLACLAALDSLTAEPPSLQSVFDTLVARGVIVIRDSEEPKS